MLIPTGRELAFRRPSLLSSIVESSYGPDKANDGTTSGGDILRCSFTQQTTDPMWQVDLGQMFTIYRIVIHSSEDDYIRSKFFFFFFFFFFFLFSVWSSDIDKSVLVDHQMEIFKLIHLSLPPHKRGICKQCRPRSDAAKRGV